MWGRQTAVATRLEELRANIIGGGAPRLPVESLRLRADSTDSDVGEAGLVLDGALCKNWLLLVDGAFRGTREALLLLGEMRPPTDCNVLGEDMVGVNTFEGRGLPGGKSSGDDAIVGVGCRFICDAGSMCASSLTEVDIAVARTVGGAPLTLFCAARTTTSGTIPGVDEIKARC